MSDPTEPDDTRDEYAVRLGARLRVLREARALALREVARRASIDAGNLSAIEHGKRGMSIRTALILVGVMGYRIHDLTIAVDCHPAWNITGGAWHRSTSSTR